MVIANGLDYGFERLTFDNFVFDACDLVFQHIRTREYYIHLLCLVILEVKLNRCTVFRSSA